MAILDLTDRVIIERIEWGFERGDSIPEIAEREGFKRKALTKALERRPEWYAKLKSTSPLVMTLCA